jgi:hypothetical protein
MTFDAVSTAIQGAYGWMEKEDLVAETPVGNTNSKDDFKPIWFGDGSSAKSDDPAAEGTKTATGTLGWLTLIVLLLMYARALVMRRIRCR